MHITDDNFFTMLREKMIEHARKQQVVPSRELCKGIDLSKQSIPYTHKEFMAKLFATYTEISSEEHKEGRPLLSALIVQKMMQMPGEGFFLLATRLGKYHGSSELVDRVVYFKQELHELFTYWASH